MKKKIIFTVLILISLSLFLFQIYILRFYEIHDEITDNSLISEEVNDYNNGLNNIYESSDTLISNVSLKDHSYIVNYEFNGEKERFLKILDEVKDRDEDFSINKINKEKENSNMEIEFSITYKVP